MYAVIKTGGKQYKVAAGEKLKVEQIPADIGSEITLDQVLAVGAGETVKFGAPLVAGATVLATVVAHGRHDKVRSSRCVVVSTTRSVKAIVRTTPNCKSSRSTPKR
jgi:large subunit ribosomal protein L21